MANQKNALQMALDSIKSGALGTMAASPIGQFASKVGQAASFLRAPSMEELGNAYNQSVRRVSSFVQQNPTPMGFVQKQVIPQVQQSVNNFRTDLPANLAYGQAKVSQAIAPKYILPTAEQQSFAQNSFNPNVAQLNDYGGPTKSMSAQLNEFPVAPNTPYNNQLEQQKQQILNTGVFRPAMKRYLSTVPVYGMNENPGSGMTDTSLSQQFRFSTTSPITKGEQNQSWETQQGPYQPDISIGMVNGKTNPDTVVPSQDKRLSAVMVHELIHAAPRNQAYKDEFIKFYENISPQSHPILYKAGLTYLENGKKPPNAEELYATLAQNQGPAILNNPEVRKFYENIFK